MAKELKLVVKEYPADEFFAAETRIGVSPKASWKVGDVYRLQFRKNSKAKWQDALAGDGGTDLFINKGPDAGGNLNNQYFDRPEIGVQWRAIKLS